MILPFFILNRYLKSKKDSRFISAVSLITIIGIIVGVVVVLVALSILDGYEKVVTQKIVDFNTHIKISAFSNRNIDSPEKDIELLNKVFSDTITRLNPYCAKLSIIKSKKNSEGITLQGITNDQFRNEILPFLVESENFTQPGNYIFVGKKLAEKLILAKGERVTIFTLHGDQIPSPENPPSIDQFIIGGIFESGMAEYDDLNAYIDIKTAQNIFGMENEVSGYNIKLKSLANIDKIAQNIQDMFGYPYYVRTIFQIHQNIFTWLELQKKPIPIILGLIIFVAVFNVISTLLMIVLERTGAIGILRSLGANKKLIVKIFLFHGLYLSVIGIAIGSLVALLFSLLQINYGIISLPGSVYFVTKVPIAINLENYLIVTLVTLIISFLASLLPSFAASKINHLTAIKFD
jgi:lipoprotein-releasing system permease protein